MQELNENGMSSDMPVQGEKVYGWRRWAPYAAVVWSLIYAAMGFYWLVSGRGFPLVADTGSLGMGPMIERFGPVVGWIVVLLAGIPAAALGVMMLRGVRKFRSLLIVAGTLLSGVLLLLMIGLNMLVMFGYTPYAIFSLIKGAEFGQIYIQTFIIWSNAHQVFCFIGGFLWLAATVCYARRSGDACLYCGRRESSDGWNSPTNAARWGRIAVYVSLVAPVFYAITRFAWFFGIPLGMTKEAIRLGQESGIFVSALSMATFGLVGALITFGLVQRWGEVFPRWMIGLAGRRVPVALAVIPVSLISVLLVVGGVGIWAALPQMISAVQSTGAVGNQVVSEIVFQVGPTLLFPLWGVSVAVATLGYYFRRRGPCKVCGRGGIEGAK